MGWHWEEEIDRLTAEVAQAHAVCDSYAKENQQFSDRIDRLQAALEEISRLTGRNDLPDAWHIASKALANEQKP